MPTFTIEQFDYGKHLNRVALMVPCKESQVELDSSPLKELGFTTAQVLMDALIGSEEAFVVIDVDSHRLLGLFGAAQQVIKGQIVIVPWFITTGFEREPQNVRPFLRASRVMLKEWAHMCRGKLMMNTCLNNPRITKWLKWLGFTVEESKDKQFVTFVKKGGT